jgi:hypothetical protein
MKIISKEAINFFVNLDRENEGKIRNKNDIRAQKRLYRRLKEKR